MIAAEPLEDRVLLSGVSPNLETSILGDIAVSGDLIGVGVKEEQMDLNGDGDVLDRVLHVFDANTNTTINLGKDIPFGPQVNGNLAVFHVFESLEGGGGQDLNGDGDTSDRVLHIYDHSTKTTTNLGYGILSTQISGHLVAFQVSESAQGQTDLNNDGDANDSDLHIYDANTGLVTNLELNAINFIFDEDLIAFAVHEPSQGGVDQNGDGDALDFVMHVYDARDSSITNTQLDGLLFGVDGNLLAIAVPEGRQGNQDLNGDGDATDPVLHIYDARDKSTINVGVSSQQLIGIDNGRVAFRVAESQEGNSDLNGDGDAHDAVMHVYDSINDTTTNVGFAFGNARLDGDVLAFAVRESAQNGTDFNGDGDSVDDVVHAYNASTNSIQNVGLDASTFRVSEGVVSILVRESRQGGVDLNGDGDADDSVLHLFDSGTDVTRNLQLAASSILHEGNWVTGSVNEVNQGNTDLNGDTFIDDFVLHVHDIARGATINTGLAAGLTPGFSGGRVALGVDEFAMVQDLNRDGDATDRVLHVVDLSIPLSNAPKIESSDVGADLHSVIVQLNDTQLRADQATNLGNYRLTIANGDANGDGDFFNDGDETEASISSIAYDPSRDEITLNLVDAVFADVYRLEIDGDGIGSDGTPGLTNENGLALQGGDFEMDLDLRVLDLVEALLDKVESLGLATSTEQSLTGRLTAATKVLGANVDSDDGLINILKSFRLGVEGWFDRGEITESDRDDLFADVDLILLGLALT